MPLSTEVAALVLLAALMHALWNTVIKMGEDRLLATALVNGSVGLIALAVFPFFQGPVPASWPFLALSMLLHQGYKLFLARAYQLGDLSQVYPVARGISPLLVAALSGAVVGEFLGEGEIFGVLLVSCGLFSLTFQKGFLHQRKGALPVLFALGTGLFITSYTLTDGLGVRRSASPGGYVVWLYILDGVLFTMLALVLRGRRAVASYFRANWRPGAFGGLMSFGAYGLVVWAMSLGAVAHVAALRETSVIFGAVIGVFFLGEPFGRRRLAASALIAAGVILLKISR